MEEACAVRERRHGSVCPSGTSPSECVWVYVCEELSLAGEADGARGNDVENLHKARPGPVDTHVEEEVDSQRYNFFSSIRSLLKWYPSHVGDIFKTLG